MSFVLYAPAQDLEMAVTTSRGRDIRLETIPKLPDVTLYEDSDPGTTVTEAFGIKRPEPGRWEVELTPRKGIQKEGSFWAVALFVQSDLRLAAQARPAVVQAGEAVVLRAVLSGPSDVTPRRSTP